MSAYFNDYPGIPNDIALYELPHYYPSKQKQKEADKPKLNDFFK